MYVGVMKSHNKDHGVVEEEYLLQFDTRGIGWIEP